MIVRSQANGTAYEIDGELGRGGMATVYLAHRQGVAGFKRSVALKVAHPAYADDTAFARMFLDEALLGARLDHPHVVRIEDFGEADGSYFIAMEHVDGSTVARLLAARAEQAEPLPVDLTARVVLDIADGLEYVHGLTGDDGEPLHIVHRDVTPSNLLLDRHGLAKLGDFGIAKNRSRLTQTVVGTRKGKPRYMSPEQAAGQTVDGRSDVYALGLVLWEMLTLRRAGPARSKASDGDDHGSNGHPGLSLPPPSQYNPAVSAALDAVVEKATAPAPEERYPSAAAFREAIDRLCSPPEDSRARLAALVRALPVFREAARAERSHTPSSSRPTAAATLSAVAIEKTVVTGETPASPGIAWTTTRAPAAPRRRGRLLLVALVALVAAIPVGLGALAALGFWLQAALPEPGALETELLRAAPTAANPSPATTVPAPATKPKTDLGVAVGQETEVAHAEPQPTAAASSRRPQPRPRPSASHRSAGPTPVAAPTEGSPARRRPAEARSGPAPTLVRCPVTGERRPVSEVSQP
jgi:serine/threonine-protein kinase